LKKLNRYGLTIAVVLLGLVFLFIQDGVHGVHSWKKTEHYLTNSKSVSSSRSQSTRQDRLRGIGMENSLLNYATMVPRVAGSSQTAMGVYPASHIVTSNHLALLRLEDIGPGGNYSTPEDLGKLRAVIDYLDTEGIPFHVTVVPRYLKLNPDGSWINRSIDDEVWDRETEAFVHFLYYMQSRGGVLGMHGYSHQYGFLKRGDDHQNSFVGNEFSVSGAPDSAELIYTQERFELSLKAFEEIGIQPAFWETPHNVASPQQRDVFCSGIGIQYESLNKKDEKPVYLKNQNLFSAPTLGSVYIPTPFYYIEGGSKSMSMVDSIVKRLPYFNGLASFFYHPFIEYSFLKPVLEGDGQPVVVDGLPLYRYQEDKPSCLKRMLDGIRAGGYRFVTIHDVVPFTPGHRMDLPESEFDNYSILTGDFDGDGQDEFARFDGQQVSVIKYNSRLPRYRRELNQSVWLDNLDQFGELKPLVGDFNQDGLDDLVLYNQQEGYWWVAFSDGESFQVPEVWLFGWVKGEEWVPYTGDFNGDDRSDLLVYSQKDHHWRTAISKEGWAVPQDYTNNQIGTSYSYLKIEDANGDSKDDLITYTPSHGLVQVILSQGVTFAQPRTWLKGWITGKDFMVGDVNGDGLADVVLSNRADGMWFMALSLGNRFIPHGSAFGPWAEGMDRKGLLGDFDGNGKIDIGSWQYLNGTEGSWIDIAYSYQG
jgi:hypothetical protein